MVSQDEQPNHNVLDVVVSKLDDRLDKLSQSLNDLKKNLHHRIVSNYYPCDPEDSNIGPES
jgi:hypothetical protein